MGENFKSSYLLVVSKKLQNDKNVEEYKAVRMKINATSLESKTSQHS